jgi:hypothetical protein
MNIFNKRRVVGMTYHHFTGNDLNRSEKIQKLVVDLLLDSKIPNEKRESSIQWELKHSSGAIQIARLLAQKRGVNIEMAEIAAALHDVHVIVNGSYIEHAKKGAEIARKILEESSEFDGGEIEKICNAIAKHSDKHIYDDDELVELVKDADCIDCFLYGDGVYDEKPQEILKHYQSRLVKVRKELGLPERIGGKND